MLRPFLFPHLLQGGLSRICNAVHGGSPALTAAVQSDLARDLLKDPYIFKPAPLDESARERALEKALLHRLKERPETKDIPVVVLSIVCDEGRSCRLGAANYLEKPIDKTRLLAIIDDIVGSVDSPKALVVDDDPGVVRVLADTLRQNGFAVAAAYDGTEAIASIEKRIPDIVISDLKMPKMDGYQLIQRIKTTPEWADIPVIIMTGYRIDRSRVDVIDLAVTSLRKPFSAQAIADEVIALLERERLGATQ